MKAKEKFIILQVDISHILTISAALFIPDIIFLSLSCLNSNKDIGKQPAYTVISPTATSDYLWPLSIGKKSVHLWQRLNIRLGTCRKSLQMTSE